MKRKQPRFQQADHPSDIDPDMLNAYARAIDPTDSLPSDDLRPILFGLFGEVGSIMAVTKKSRREQHAYTDRDFAAVEELGDVFWYFARLCRRIGLELHTVFPTTTVIVPTLAESSRSIDSCLIRLGRTAGNLLTLETLDHKAAHPRLSEFSSAYLATLEAHNISLGTVLSRNRTKVRGRFLSPAAFQLPTFDFDFPPDERIPTHFNITIQQRADGHSQMSWKGVFIGDPLADNIRDPDGYRFHDVFHLAHAAILHWSPTFRALIKHKRKSDPAIDESEDGGRAIVIEEGLTAWLFSRAKQLDLFESHTSLSFDLLKTVSQFVSEYEVSQCPLSLWETAILQGYNVFRQMLHNGGGVIIGNREDRSVRYQTL